MKATPIFNPTGNDNPANRLIWFGETTNLMQLNDVRHNWAIALYQQMREQFWIPQRLDISQDVNDYNNLTNEERRAFDGILSYLTFLDSVQTCNIPHLKLPVTAPEISLCMGEQISQECFDDQTEILTSEGWKFFRDLTEFDMVAQYHLDNKWISMVRPSRIIKRDHEGEMILFESSHTSICVTPNHDLINIHPVTKVARKRFAKETKGGNYSYPKTGIFNVVFNSFGLPDLTLLLVAVAADGTVRVFDKTSNQTSHVQMHLTKKRKRQRIEELLCSLDIDYTMSRKSGSDGYCYSFTLPNFITQDAVKNLEFIQPNILSPISANELLDNILFWDGNQKNSFYTTNKKAADMVQFVALVAGKNASVGINRTQEQSSQTVLPSGSTAIATKTCYVVTVSNCQTKVYPNPSIKQYSGKVYCVTVPLGNIVTRRDGKVAITGNCMHNQSYQYMIETIIPTDRRSVVYDFWRTDKVLKERCEYIAGMYQNYVDNPTDENYFVALFADYVLEGLYFYTGFTFFYTLASRQLMPGSADIFKMINRDELSHVRLYQKIIPEAIAVLPHSTDQLYEIFDNAVSQEVTWTNHIIGDNILGITPHSTEQYVKFLANKRLKAIGLNELYPDAKTNPYKHLEKFADTGAGGETKGNFFESTVTSYSMSSALAGWNDI